MSVYTVHLLHALANQGHYDLRMSKLGLVASATLQLGINIMFSYRASDQAECQDSLASGIKFSQIQIFALQSN